MNYVTPKDVTSEIPKEIVDFLNEIILEKTPASTREPWLMNASYI